MANKNIIELQSINIILNEKNSKNIEMVQEIIKINDFLKISDARVKVNFNFFRSFRKNMIKLLRVTTKIL